MNPSWEANTLSGQKQIPTFYGNEIHYCVYKNLASQLHLELNESSILKPGSYSILLLVRLVVHACVSPHIVLCH